VNRGFGNLKLCDGLALGFSTRFTRAALATPGIGVGGKGKAGKSLKVHHSDKRVTANLAAVNARERSLRLVMIVTVGLDTAAVGLLRNDGTSAEEKMGAQSWHT